MSKNSVVAVSPPARVRASVLSLPTAVWAALIAGVALVLGVIRLSAPSFWVDEAFTARAVGLPFPDYVVNQYHSLYYVLLQPWVALAGTSESALRFPSVIAAVASCVLVFQLGRQVLDRWVGLVASLLLATSPFFVKWSQQARSYSLLVAASLLATILLLRALRAGTRVNWLVYGLVFSGCIVVQPVAALVLVPSHGTLAFQQRARIGRHSFVAAIVMVAVCLPWMFIVSRFASEFWLVRPSFEGAVKTLLEVSGATWFGTVLAAAGVVVLLRRRQGDVARWLLVWAFVPFLLAWAISFAKPVYLDRYLIAAAPAFALLGGAAIIYVGRRLRVAFVAGAVVATVVGLASWYSYDAGTNWRGEGWERAVVETRAKLEPGDAIVVVPWWASPAASYYGAPVADTSTADSIWVLTWSEDGHDIDSETRRGLGFGDHRLEQKTLYGWRVSAQHWKRP